MLKITGNRDMLFAKIGFAGWLACAIFDLVRSLLLRNDFLRHLVVVLILTVVAWCFAAVLVIGYVARNCPRVARGTSLGELRITQSLIMFAGLAMLIGIRETIYVNILLREMGLLVTILQFSLGLLMFAELEKYLYDEIESRLAKRIPRP